MDEQLAQFLSSVEASARRILKQQNRKQQELAARDREALARGDKATATTAKSDAHVTRDELQASYSSALVVQAPPPRSPARSESADDDRTLPKLHTAASPQSEPAVRGSGAGSSLGSASSPLPAIDRSATHQRREALVAAKHASRDRRAASGAKLLASPLYRSLGKPKPEPGFGSPTHSIKKALHDVDNVGILLRKMGLRGAAGSPSQRPDHAVERRMCNACWASPDKLTGCEHHSRVLPPRAGRDAAAVVRSLELQGPTSWLSDDLFVKYRSESDREALWDAFVQLKEDEKRAQEEEQEAVLQGHRLGPSQHPTGQQQQLPVIPVVTRHPVLAKFFAQIALENLRTHAETRKRNQSKVFVFDVNHLWLTNLDHFNAHQVAKTRRQQRRQLERSEEVVQSSEAGDRGDDQEDERDENDDDDDNEGNALSDRRDEAAIRQGYSQIQSVSTSRALQHAVLPAFDPSNSSFASSSRHLTSPSPGETAHQTLTSPLSQRPEFRTATKKKKRGRLAAHPLSLVVCGRWQLDAQPNTLDSVPGLTLTGTNRVLWWRYPYDGDEVSGGDRTLERTKVVAMFARDAQLSSSNAILVSVVLALDSPLLSQLWFAWCVGSVAPPAPLPLPDALLTLQTPHRVSPCTWSLVSTPLQSRFDKLLPCTTVVLDNAAQAADHTLLLDEPFGHRRHWPEMNPDGFRQWWLASDTLAPNYDVEPQACSVLTAQPNPVGVCGRFCWHSTDQVDTLLCRSRGARDYHYIVHNDTTSGSNAPMYFAASMVHEAMVGVHAAKLSAYLALLAERQRQKDYEAALVEIEQKLQAGRLLLDAKRQEQKRIEQELAAAKVNNMRRSRSHVKSGGDDAVEREWAERLQQSVVREEQGDWQLREVTADDARVVFYHSLNPHLPPLHRYSWERPGEWQQRSSDDRDEDASKEPDGENLTSRSDASSSAASDKSDDALDAEKEANGEALAKITRGLLEDQQFLQILKDKLGLTALESAVSDHALVSKPHKQSHREGDSRALDGDDNDDALQLDWDDQMLALTEESDGAKASLMATKMAKLQLLPSHQARTRPMVPGEGWKRLKASALPRNFARSVYSSHTEGPRSAFINQPNHAAPVGMLDPADASAYEAREFIPELRTHFVPKANADLQERKAAWAEFRRTRPPAAGEASGVRSASGSGGAGSGASPSTPLDELLEGDPAEAQLTMEERVSKAVLCARNNNLEGVRLGWGWLSLRCCDVGS